jgi:hypothetical protein
MAGKRRPSNTGNAKYVIEQFTALGIEVKAGSRIMEMHDLMQREHIPFEDENFMIALQAMKDLVELGFIFDQLNGAGNKDQFRKICKLMLMDSALPQNDRINSQGRDSQFELYLAAICQKAGMRPVDYEEPDVTCHVDGEKFCIAAKRIKTDTQARGRINKAARQIKKAGLPGIIALDMSIAWNKKNIPITSQLQNRVYNQMFDVEAAKFLAKHVPWLGKNGISDKVLGIVIFKFSVHVVDGKWSPRRNAMWHEFRKSGPDSLFNRFFERFNSVETTYIEELPDKS